MIDDQKRLDREQEKEQVRKRMRVQVDPENYEFIPEIKQRDYFDNDVTQRVAIYVRVSTDNVKQTTSYELQKKYYEDFVVHHPNWELVKIYADEGISGTSLKHRKQFLMMIEDCKAGKIDMIICKNVSRFARNVYDCIGIVRDLAALDPPVGVFFESEHVFSLKEDSQMGLTFLASFAEEESHIRSRSMETSLRMRLDNGIPLTPKLLGYTHDSTGHLIVNPEEARTVKLAFYMYLYGYSTQQIADTLIALGRKSYKGNIKWTSGSIVQILRNERHCGEVLTRKTYTPNFRDHLSKKNRGQRPQSRYKQHHEAIVSRDDFIAVQRMLDNAKYGNKSILPELRVMESGALKGFVSINPRWAAFKEGDYLQAAYSVFNEAEVQQFEPLERNDSVTVEVRVEEGDFDLRGFEIARSEFFDSTLKPCVSFSDKKISFSTTCVRKFGKNNYVELLVNPLERKFAVRPTHKSNRNGVQFSTSNNGVFYPKTISAAAFFQTLYMLFDWNPDYKYRMTGTLYEQDGEMVYIFNACESEAFFKSFLLTGIEQSQPLTPSGKHIRAIPQQWTTSFGKQVYVHEQTYAILSNQSEDDWKLRVEGQLFETGRKLEVTSFDELRSFIRQELEGINLDEEDSHARTDAE
ncbi:MAG: recombinase family protein [Clostridia bacterium]|nr:recombinase family protein [Clostridia bacterium]